MKQLLLTLIALTSLVNASDVMKTYDTLFELSQTDRGYALKNDTFSMHFPRHQVSKSIRDLRADQLAVLLKSNAYYLKATELSDGTHALDLQGRVQGGGWFGASYGAAAVGILGSEGSKYVFIGGSVACLFLAQGAVHVFAGAQKGAEFHEKITNRFMPHVYEIAEEVVGPMCGMVGAGIGAVAGSTAPI